MTTTEELDALDKRVAELRGWKQDPDDADFWIAPEGDQQSFPMITYDGGTYAVTLDICRDAHQWGVLLEEFSDDGGVYRHGDHWVADTWERDGISGGKGDTPGEAVVRAWIALEETKRNG